MVGHDLPWRYAIAALATPRPIQGAVEDSGAADRHSIEHVCRCEERGGIGLHHSILSPSLIPCDLIGALEMMNDPLHRFPKWSSVLRPPSLPFRPPRASGGTTNQIATRALSSDSIESAFWGLVSTRMPAISEGAPPCAETLAMLCHRQLRSNVTSYQLMSCIFMCAHPRTRSSLRFCCSPRRRRLTGFVSRVLREKSHLFPRPRFLFCQITRIAC